MDTDSAVREILQELRALVSSSEDGGIYGDRAKALRDIDQVLASGSSNELRRLLGPTGNLQELALENGWGAEFNSTADRLERLL